MICCSRETKTRHRINSSVSGIAFKYFYCEICRKSYNEESKEINQDTGIPKNTEKEWEVDDGDDI